MKRVEFNLSMPGRNSWNNKWSGDDKSYVIVRELDDEFAAKLGGRRWSYSWPDSWRAEVHARLMPDSELRPPQQSFIGYDWMVDSILRYDAIYAEHERPVTPPVPASTLVRAVIEVTPRAVGICRACGAQGEVFDFALGKGAAGLLISLCSTHLDALSRGIVRERCPF